MQSSLPTEPAVQNIKAVDVAEFAETAEIVATSGGFGNGSFKWVVAIANSPTVPLNSMRYGRTAL
jgi:hypothetical protein